MKELLDEILSNRDIIEDMSDTGCPFETVLKLQLILEIRELRGKLDEISNDIKYLR